MLCMSQAFPLPSLSRKQRTVLVVCGPEQNGAVGLACARHLRVFVSNRAVMRGTEMGPGFPPASITEHGFPHPPGIPAQHLLPRAFGRRAAP